MTISLAVALNVVLDVLLLSLLAYVMSRPKSLTPHVAEAERELVALPADEQEEQIAA
jgi:hypothetical protein